MSIVATPAPPTPPAPVISPVPREVAIPEVSSGPAGAQAVKPAPPNTIPPPMKAYSDRPDSAKAKMLERLKAKGKTTAPVATPEATKPPVAKAEDPKPTETPDDDPDDLLDEKATVKSPVEEGKVIDPEKPLEPQVTPNPKAKINPWKLADEHKAARAKAEQEIVELKKLMPNAEARKAELAEVESLRKENEELQRHMKYVDFKQSKDYAEKYEKPYMSQWKTSMQELQGVTVEDPEMGARGIEPNDLLRVVNEPTAVKARQLAKELFGEEYATDVMAEREKIVSLHKAKIAAEEEAKAEGTQKYAQMSAAQKATFDKLNTEVNDTFQRAVLSIKSSPVNKEFFEQIEGDDDANNTLIKGYELVDKAFQSNPMDPSLTSEQRASITKLHAAIRHRAAGFGRARYLLQKERAAHAATQKKLAAYEGTVPNRGPSMPSSAPQMLGQGTGMAAMKERLRARAARRP